MARKQEASFGEAGASGPDPRVRGLEREIDRMGSEDQHAFFGKLHELMYKVAEALMEGDLQDEVKKVLDQGVAKGKLTQEEREETMSAAMGELILKRRQMPYDFDIFGTADAYFPNHPELRRQLFTAYRKAAKSQIEYWNEQIEEMQGTIKKMEEQIGPEAPVKSRKS